MKELSHTIDIRDVARLQGPLAFQVMIKPCGASCNLRCDYCYYTGGADRPPGTEVPMPDALLEKVVREAIAANDGPEVTFTWHGGEPLLAGLSFFRRAVALQRRFSGGKKVINTIQTNGTRITAEWAAFFRKHGFLVGLSLDGPEDIHDAFRRDHGRQPTFTSVMRGLERLQKAGVAYNTLTTVNARSEGRGREVYEFLRGAGSRHLQFLPVSEPGMPEYNVSGEGFGRFLCDVFDVWVRRDVGETFVSTFDAALCRWCGLQPGICIFARTCADVLTVESCGDVYCCDHFADSGHRLGNIATSSFREMMASPARIRFLTDKSDMLPSDCRRCPWLPACHGECPQHRSDGRNRLCEGYRLFFTRTAPYFDRMRALLDLGQAPACIMAETAAEKNI